MIARNSSFTYKGQAVDVKQVGRELGVRYVLEGSVRKAGNRVRITGQLIDATTGVTSGPIASTARSTTFSTFRTESPRALSGHCSRSSDRPRLSGRGASPPKASTPMTSSCGRSRRSGPPLAISSIEAIALLERAMALDPSYAFATALCAWSYANRNLFLWTDDLARERDTALRLATRAASLDSEDPFVLAILGSAYTLGGQFVEAMPLIDKSLAIDPNSAFAWVRNGWLKIRLADPDAAIACFERAMRISPLDSYNFTALLGIGYAHLVAERFEKGAFWITKGIAAKPSATYAWWFLVAAHVALDRMDEAREALAKLTAGNPGLTASLVAKSSTLPNPAFRQLVLEGAAQGGPPRMTTLRHLGDAFPRPGAARRQG